MSRSVDAVVDVTEFGAEPNDGQSDLAAFVAALRALPLAGGCIRVPAGTFVISPPGLQLDRRHISVLGAGVGSTIIERAHSGQYHPIFAMNGGADFVEVSGMTLLAPSANSRGEGIVVQHMSASARVWLHDLRFERFADRAIVLADVGGGVVEDSVFDSEGEALGIGVQLEDGTSHVLIRRNRFRFLREGIINATPRSPGHADAIEIRGNDFDMGWWTIRALLGGAGPSVRYSGNELVDSRGPFGAVDASVTDVLHNVRAMVRLATTSAEISGRTVTVSAGLADLGVRQGDLLRTADTFGIVAAVSSGHQFTVEAWFGRDHYEERIAAIGRTELEIIRPRLAAVWPYRGGPTGSATALPIRGWFDAHGATEPPPDGTPYEVLVRRPNYAIHLDRGIRRSVVAENTIRHGWSDQISMYAFPNEETGNVIAHNVIEDGEDMGITVHGRGNVIFNNRIVHQGCGGIYLDSDDDVVVGNDVRTSGWLNGSVMCGEITLDGSSRTSVLHNRVDGGGRTRFGIVMASRGALAGGNFLAGNDARNHAVANILLFARGGSLHDVLLSRNQGGVALDGLVEGARLLR